MKEHCRLWIYKTSEKGEIYAQGCSLQFLGLSQEEITKNFTIKNKQILAKETSLKNKKNNPDEKE